MIRDYTIRALDTSSSSELDLVTRRAMDTVLETIPDFDNSESAAHAVLGNFTFDQMRRMLHEDLDNPAHCILVAIAPGGDVCGHAIFSVKTDRDGRVYGFCYSRYVHPDHRRNGVGSSLLGAQLVWWRERGAQYAYAQTHVTNKSLQGLFRKHGFQIAGPRRGNWDYYELRRDL